MQPTSIEFIWPNRLMGLPVAHIKWNENDSVRCRGAVNLSLQITVIPNKEYADSIRDIVDSVELLIKDAYEDYIGSDPAPGQVEEEQENAGMGDDIP